MPPSENTSTVYIGWAGKEKVGAGGIGKLYINDEKVGEGRIPRTPIMKVLI